jgi:two-component system, sensor histidine kinase and response regulator
MAVGMDGYLSKPLRPQELDEVLDSILAPKEELSTSDAATAVSNGSVDVTQLLDRIDDDRSLLAELIDIFRREYPENLQAAQRAIDARDPEELHRAGHTLKGALGNLAAGGASDLASELEALGRSGHVAGAQVILDKLVQELTRVMRALESLSPVVVQ